MGVLRKMDIFKSVNPENKDGTLLGTLLTFLSFFIVFFFFYKEFGVYTHQKLYSKLYVEETNFNNLIPVMFDIQFQKLKCDVIRVSLQKQYTDFTPIKKQTNQGCRISASFKIKSVTNTLSFSTDISTSIMDLITNSLQVSGVKILNKPQMIDFSHHVNYFQFGSSVRKLKKLEKIYPDMIKATPLNNIEYVSKDEKDGHSLFLYELNIVNSTVNGRNELIYNFNRNTINSMTTNPFVRFEFEFSPISIEYQEGNESFLDFLGYLLGLIGGILSAIKIFNNFIFTLFFKKKEELEQIPQTLT